MARPQKIAIMVTLPELGGAQSHVLQILDGLDRQKFEPVLLTAGEGWLTDRAAERGVRCYPLRFLTRPIRPHIDILALAELVSVLRRERPDVLHLHSSKSGILGRLAGKLAAVPVVIFTAHGFSFHEQLRPAAMQAFAFLERVLAPLADRIVPVSEYDRKRAIAFRVCRPEQIHVIPNGVSLSRFEGHDRGAIRQQLGAREESVLIGMVARCAFPKDHEGLLTAMRPLLLERASLRLLLIGGGRELPRLQELSEHMGIAGQVEFLGDRTDVPALLAALDIFVLATKFEGLPIAVLEAMASGLPVVASHVGGVSELVEHGANGLLVPPGSPEALRAALETLIEDPETRARFGRAGREKAGAEFSEDWMVRRIEALYSG